MQGSSVVRRWVVAASLLVATGAWAQPPLFTDAFPPE